MAKRRRNLKDLLTPDPTPDKQLVHPSGWCMTADHNGCKYQFDHGKCGCSCHLAPKSGKSARTNASNDNKTQKTQRPRKAVAGITPTKIVVDEATDYVDPRPWKR